LKVAIPFLALFVLLLACEVSLASDGTHARFDIMLSKLFTEDEKEESAQQTEAPAPASGFGLPGWWGYGETKDHFKAGFFPFYYRYRDDNYSITHIWPLYGYKNRKQQYETHYLLYPFFRYTSYQNDAKQVECPWPFVLYYKGSRKFHFHIFPLLWADVAGEWENTAVLFPVFWHFKKKESRTSIVFPVYWDIKIPEARLWHLWPIYGYSSGAGWHRTLYGFPLLRYTRRWDPDTDINDQPADRQVDFVWPFIKLRLGPLNKQFHLFPFYYGKIYEKDPEDGKIKLNTRYCWLPPLFWYHSNPRAVYLHIWPVGVSKTRDGDEKRYDIAFPLLSIHSIKSKDTYEISIPFLLAFFKYERRATIVQFNKYWTKGYNTSIRLWPVFNYSSRPGHKYVAVHPLFSYRKRLSMDEEAESTFSVAAGLLFHHRQYLTKTQWHFLLGVASYKSDEDGYDFRILAGLLGLGRKDDDSYFRLFWLKL